MVANTQTLLVTGASGHLGRRAVELLLQAKAGTVIAASRSPEKLADLAARGAVLRKVDFDDEASLSAAFAGVSRVLLVSTDAVGRPGQRLAQHERAISAAARAGVKHIVYTSFSHPDEDSSVTLAPDHRETEAALARSGVDFTVLRNNLYADNLLQSLPSAVASGQLFAAAGDHGAAYVTREDCARAAAAALASPQGTRTLEITGPAVVGYAELARLLSELTGRTVTYVPVPPDGLRAGMIGAGLPAPVADLLVSFDVGMAEGKFGPKTSAVTDLTGRPPASVRELLSAHREMFFRKTA